MPISVLSNSLPIRFYFPMGLWLALSVGVSVGQVITAPNHYSVEAGAFHSSAAVTPFWLRANQYGTVPYNAPAYTGQVAIRADYDSTRKFAIGYGANVVANSPQSLLPYEKAVLLPEAYVKVKLGIFEAYAGRRREVFGLADSTLSSGSYIWSGNAMPVPKIQVGIPRFTPIGFTKGWIAVMGMFSHGVFDETGYIRNTKLHQSALYFRVGRPSETFRAYAGFNHQVVWSGHAADPVGIPGIIPPGGQLPSGLQDYLYVVFGVLKKSQNANLYTTFDQTNRIGNHLGTLDVGLDINLKRHSVFLYRQNIYEDGSLFYLTNIADGLNGIRLRRNNPHAVVRDFLVEFLNTTSQGGPEFIIEEPKKRGRDDYFNNQQFRDGWAYRQHTIGTPFIPPALGPNGEYPYGVFTLNNRVRVFHVGLGGSLPIEGGWLVRPITYQVKLSHSENYGTYLNPYRTMKPQWSGYIGLNWPLNVLGGLDVITRIAGDQGNLYPDNIGGYLGLRKAW